MGSFFLLDALTGNTNARSVIALCLNLCFQARWPTVYDAIANSFGTELEKRVFFSEYTRRLSASFPKPKNGFWLLGADGTPYRRLFSPTLTDRTYVFEANVISGNKPITIGHKYSILCLLPEKQSIGSPNWVLPLSAKRIMSASNEQTTGSEQLNALLGDDELPFCKESTVLVVDCNYGKAHFILDCMRYSKLTTIVRMKNNRKFYRQAEQSPCLTRGRPKVYGDVFDLKDSQTHSDPIFMESLEITTKKGKKYTIKISGHNNLLMRGKKDFPIQKHPFLLIHIQMYNMDGTIVNKRPMWLAVFGERPPTLTPELMYNSYRSRFDMEHYNRFAKRNLLMTAFQTSETAHEENWVDLSMLAYQQLWLARNDVSDKPVPWNKNKKPTSDKEATPSEAQRGFFDLLGVLGTPAQPPKPRGKSPGGTKNQKNTPKPKHEIIKKQRKSAVLGSSP